MNKTNSTWKTHKHNEHDTAPIAFCYYCMIENKNKEVDFTAQNLAVEEKRQLDLSNRRIKRAQQKLNGNK